MKDIQFKYDDSTLDCISCGEFKKCDHNEHGEGQTTVFEQFLICEQKKWTQHDYDSRGELIKTRTYDGFTFYPIIIPKSSIFSYT